MKPAVALEQITRVYSGRPGCACGCRGNYSESPRAKKMALKRYLDATTKIEEDGGSITSEGENFVYWDNPEGTRTYTIYFKAAV